MQEIEDFVQADPYIKAGLVTNWYEPAFAADCIGHRFCHPFAYVVDTFLSDAFYATAQAGSVPSAALPS